MLKIIVITSRPKSRRRWVQFSLRSFLILSALFGVWLGLRVKAARDQKDAVDTVLRVGGRVRYDYQPSAAKRMRRYTERTSARRAGLLPPVYTDEPWAPAWLRRLAGDDLIGTRITARGLKHLQSLKNLRRLAVGVPLNDAALEQLGKLTKLEFLGPLASSVTDVGLAKLAGMTKLEYLVLRDTQVTDAGLEHVQKMTGLRGLWLENTSITDSGLRHLKGLRKLEMLDLADTHVGDAGLVHIKGLGKLKQLDLRRLPVTDAGIEQLQEALPGCRVYR